MNIKDGNNLEKFKTVQKTGDGSEFKGMTDEQIKNKVRKDLGNPNLKDSEIQIIRDGDNVKIKVISENSDKSQKIELK